MAAAATGRGSPVTPGLVPAVLKPGPVLPGPAAAAEAVQPAAASSGPAAASLAKTTLMLRNLGTKVSNEVLVEELRLFGLEGRVDFVHVWRDFKTKSCKGYAYVNFFHPADALALQAMWHMRKDLGGIPCHPRPMNIAFAHRQGFDNCALEGRRRGVKDVVGAMGWIHPSRASRCVELEQNTLEMACDDHSGPPPGLAGPQSPPGFWGPPGLAELARVKRVSGCAS